MMSKQTIGLLGTLVLIVSFWSGANIRKNEKIASRLDDNKTVNAVIMGPPPCRWEVLPPERVISENSNQAVVINTLNTGDEDCESVLYLQAPNFTKSPSKDEQKIVLPVGGSGSISWIITPNKTGSYQIAVTDDVSTKIFGIVVNNMFGLNSLQAKILSVLGTLFGPMLTVPWWWDRLKKNKKT